MTRGDSVRPTYIGIGAQKCASTWLHRILAEHPQVGVGLAKEVDFFSHRFDRGYQWYEAQFVDCGQKTAIGEISPSYFCEPAVPERIARYVPDAKILLSLRDPIERALSNHRHEVRVGHFTGDGLSFEAGLANNPMYVEQGRYATHLKRWLEHFPRDQVLVVLKEDIDAAPESVAREVYEFVGVDPCYRPQGVAARFNPSYANRSRLLARIKDGAYGATRGPGLNWLWNVGAATGAKGLYRRFNVVRSETAIPPPSERALAELRQVFAPEVAELSKLLGRPLNGWLA
jgi:hypothetical protein